MTEDDLDRLALTGQLPPEAEGHIDFAEAFGCCVDQPHPRERAYERARHQLVNDARAVRAAGRLTHEENPSNE